MPSQEDWILRAARLFPSPTPDYIRTSDVPLVLICLDISDDDMQIRRALGVGRVREIPIANLVRMLSPILPAENSSTERFTMFRVFDEWGNGVVGLQDLQRVALGARLLTAKECERIMNSLANTGNGITFDRWCHLLRDESTPASTELSGGESQLGATFGGVSAQSVVDAAAAGSKARAASVLRDVDTLARSVNFGSTMGAASAAALDSGVNGPR